MFRTQSPTDKSKRSRRLLPLLSGVLIVAALVGALVFSINARGGAHAASTATNAAVSYANSHWNCATAACTSRVPAGAAQPNFQCAEFVARSLAAEGKVPGLNANSSQSAFGSYHARNGHTYDLLWVGVNASGYNDGGIPGLYQYLTQNGVGTNIGNTPSRAVPGDVTFHFEGAGHTGLLVQTGSNPLADFHNNARYHVYYTEGYSTIIVHIGGKLPPACPATIQNGSSGSLVASLQSKLDSLYASKAFPNSPYNFHPPLAKDGQFGPLTANAVKDFQKKKGIGVDGIVGPQTWHALGNC